MYYLSAMSRHYGICLNPFINRWGRSGFSPLVVALPYMHPSLPEGQYKDAGMFEFCEPRNIKVISGYDKETNEWRSPASLMPDYVFFQTPYPFFPPLWSVEQISMMARICYVPYGGCIYAGEVDEIVNPIRFFAHVNMVFKENLYTKNKFEQRFRDNSWFCDMSIFISGCPKIDFLVVDRSYTGILWRRRLTKKYKANSMDSPLEHSGRQLPFF